jgi:integrase
MSSIKVILKKNKQTADGQIPIYLRIIKDRDTRFISLGVKVLESQWDFDAQKVKKSHPNSKRMNAFLASKVAEAESETLDMMIEGKSMNESSFNELKGKAKIDFYSFAEKYAASFQKKGQIGTYRRALAVINKIKEFNGEGKLEFKDITVSFLKRYEEFMAETKKNKVNTIQANFKMIRTIMNNAVSEDLMKRDKNPFYKFKVKSEPTSRAYLTEEELKTMDELDLVGDPILFNHRNMYVFAAYVGGLRVSDMLLLKWENFDGTHINLKIKKTGATLSIKVPTRGIEILDIYKKKTFLDEKGKEQPGYFIFPVLDKGFDNFNSTAQHNALSSATAFINKNLKAIAKRAKIEKNVSFHTSRHTFGTRALRKGVRIEYVSKLMGHATIKETQAYAKIVNEELDKAMDVFN